MIALAVILVALLTALIATPLVRFIGLKWKFVDHPGERKLHRQPIVRIGGLSICLGTVAAALVIWQMTGTQISSAEMFRTWSILAGGLGFFVIGFADDIWNLHPLLRLLLQALVTTATWVTGLQIEFVPLPVLGAVPIGLLSLPITFLWLAGVANAINWLDGMDGLAAGISVFMALAFAIVCFQANHLGIALLAIALAGSALGFLRYNTNPAKIFMGDSGSYFIGFVLAGIGISGLMAQAIFKQVALPYVILIVPILDMIFVILSRVLDGKSPFFPDQRHLHHRLIRTCGSRQTTVWTIYALTIWTGLSAILLTNVSLGWLSSIVAILILCSTNPYLGQQVLQLLSKQFLLRRLIFPAADAGTKSVLGDELN